LGLMGAELHKTEINRSAAKLVQFFVFLKFVFLCDYVGCH
jgi:hypothetical protein